MSDLPVSQLLTVDQAISILDSIPLQPHMSYLPLAEAVGRILAEDVFSDSDYPPFDKAVMDGFAVRSVDAVLGADLRVIDTIAAGNAGHAPIGPGQAAAIMTGAPLPTGADAVIPVELTERRGNQVVLKQAVSPGQAIARRGSDTANGRLLLAKGTRIGPAQVGVAATVGKSSIAIYAAPSVAVLATGDELVEIDQTPTGSQIRNSNLHMLAALLGQLGCSVRSLGIARDDPKIIREAIREGLKEDALFVTGGMSMGEHDYVPRLLGELGLTLRISKLRIKPGKPFVFATGNHPIAASENPALVFGLPGNPVSAFVCTLRLASRVLARIGGGHPDTQLFNCKTLNDIPANGPRETYLPAHRTGDQVEILPSNGSADLFTLGRASALVIRTENAPAAIAGDSVSVMNLP